MKDMYFIIGYYDAEEDMRYQRHYWTTEKGYCYCSIEREDGVTLLKKRISEERFINAYEEAHNY